MSAVFGEILTFGQANDREIQLRVCALLQADGHTDLEHNVNQGDGTDLFSGVNGVALSNLTNPSTRLWNGSESGLVISDIAVPNVRLGFRVGTVTPVPPLRAENTTMVPIPDNKPAGSAAKSILPRPEW